MSDINEVGKRYDRPWGFYRTIAIDSGYQVKEISVNPGAKLSLQSHQHRAEHWVVAKGEAIVTNGEETKAYSVNQAIYIPKKAKHRLANESDEPVIIVEVQIGEYLGEDDIVRYDDIYNRT